MKKLRFLPFISLFALLQIMVFSCKDEAIETPEQQEPEEIPVVETDTVVRDSSGTIAGHIYVDLGLSVKWAYCNLGANNSYDYGDYYMWGYTTKWTEDAVWEKMDRTGGNETHTLLPKYDAASENWGEEWRIPTNDEISELIKNCKWEWTKNYQGSGISGYVVTASNGNYIFLPAAGNSKEKKGAKGYYWDSYVLSSTTEGLVFDTIKFVKNTMGASIGMSIRPVVATERPVEVIRDSSGIISNHVYVDLGLSVKWANCNIGATKSTEYGDYYMWGYTTTWKSGDSWEDMDRTGGYGFHTLLSKYDAATVNWGEEWRMPTDDEMTELIKNCKWTWTADHQKTGVAGYIVTAANGNAIFLPAAGCSNGDKDVKGYYWNSYSLSSTMQALVMDKTKFLKEVKNSSIGMSIRPVVATEKPVEVIRDSSGIISNHVYVDLGLSVKWANCNLGALKSSDYGDYYMWGYTTSWSGESWQAIDRTGEELRILIPEYDAATVNWGNNWRMPTNDELSELKQECKWTWTIDYQKTGVAGYIVTAENGNSIFLPAAGCTEGGQGKTGYYWDSYVLGPSEQTSTAEGITIDDFKYIKDMMLVNVGRSIRPVVNENKDTGVERSGTVMSHDYVDLGLSVKWATCNIGSSSPEEYGDYFAWGFHIPWNEDAFDQYFYWIDFCGDDSYLDQRFDMAATSWGKAWRLPTEKEYKELFQNCTWRWITDYKNSGTVGYLGKSQKNGNYIFLPAGGKKSADGITYSTGEGYYWSSYLLGNQYTSLSAHGVKILKGLRDDDFETRYNGQSVRAVVDNENNTEYVNKDALLNLDGSKPTEDANETAIQGVTVNGKYGSHTYVDLGLPSRTLWATYNVGGSSTDSKGNYYAWGETETRDYYKEENYKFFGGFDELTDNMIMSKYNTNKTFGTIDKKTVLDAIDDAATQNMGSDWRMPTKQEMEELINACAWKSTTINGVPGHLGVSKLNRNKIFLPAMDFKYMDVSQGQFVIYWTSSLYTEYSIRAYAFTSGDTKNEALGWGRHQGIPVRAVVNRKLEW